MTVERYIEDSVLAVLKSAGHELSTEDLVNLLRSQPGFKVVTLGAVKSAMMALAAKGQIELSGHLKLKLPEPPEPDKRPRELLAKLLKNRSMKLVTEDRGGQRRAGNEGVTYYTFESKPKDLPRSVRVDIVRLVIHDDGSKDKVYRSKRETQKFLAIAGPYDGDWLLDGEVDGYVRFNCSTTSGRRRGEPKQSTAVLVHEAVFA